MTDYQIRHFYRGDTCGNCKVPVTINNKTGLCRRCRPRPLWVKKKISLSQMGKNNSNWKGNDLSYGGIHDRMKKLLPRPDFCEECKADPAHDLANISGKYLLDIKDWHYLCRSCHMKSDGRLDKFLKYSVSMEYSSENGTRKCKNCKSQFMPTTQRNTVCRDCQFSDARRKKYQKQNNATAV